MMSTLRGSAPTAIESSVPTSIGSVGVVTVVLPAGSSTSRITGATATSPMPPPTAHVASFKNPRRSGASAIAER